MLTNFTPDNLKASAEYTVKLVLKFKAQNRLDVLKCSQNSSTMDNLISINKDDLEESQK